MKTSSFLGMGLVAAMSALGASSTPKLPVAPHMREIPRQRRKAMGRAAALREMNETGRIRNLKCEADAKKAAFQQVVNALTNHERNLWAKAGYPGLRSLDIGGPATFDRSGPA